MDADDGRHAAENARFAVFAIQGNAGCHDFLFIVENCLDNGRSRRADAVFRAVLALVGYPAAADSSFFHVFPVKGKAGIVAIVGQRFAAEVDDRPGNHLGVAVFAHHISREGVVFQARLLHDGADEAGRIQSRAGAQYAALRQAALLGD